MAHTSQTLNDIISDLEQDYTDNCELLTVLKNLRETIELAHAQALEVGTTFQMIRIGEDHPKISETRRELDKVYTPLAKIIDNLYFQATGEAY